MTNVFERGIVDIKEHDRFTVSIRTCQKGGNLMFKNKFKLPIILSIMVAVLAGITSILGLVFPELYRDNDVIKVVWFVNDLVTLFLGVPLLLGALYLAIRGSIKAQLIWIGTIWYMIYNYIFYLYGAAVNKFFLLYVALFILSVYALIFTFVKVDIKDIAQRFNPRTPVKAVCGFMFFFAFALGVPWVGKCLAFVFGGPTPTVAEGVIFATDLCFMISVLIVSGILLYKKQPWGYVLSIMVMIKGIFYPIILIVGGILAYIKLGVWDEFIPVYSVLWAACIVFIWLLLKNIQEDGRQKHI